MLETMGAEDERARTLKKDELVDWVAEQVAARTWAPASLSWRTSADEGVADSPEGPTDEDGEDVVSAREVEDVVDPDADGNGDGVGAFAVTPSGEAALRTTAA